MGNASSRSNVFILECVMVTGEILGVTCIRDKKKKSPAQSGALLQSLVRRRLVAVVFRRVRTVLGDGDIVGLLLGEFGELNA